MAEHVTVQWCPCCKAWSRVSLIERQITIRSVPSDEHGSVERAHLQARHQCGACSGEIVTVRPFMPDGIGGWAPIRNLGETIARSLEGASLSPT